MRSTDRNSTEAIDALEALAKAQACADRVTDQAARTERLAVLGTLAAGIAHEINNLLTPVLAYAQMASAHPEDRDLQAKAIEKTLLGVEAAARIAESILGFSSTDQAQECDVRQVVSRALNCLARDPNKDRIEIAIDVQPGTRARMNPLHLQQVLLNLVLNSIAAIRQTGRGGKLTIAALTRANGTVGVRVSDTGPGIPKDVVGRIFEPFFSANPAPKEDASSSEAQHSPGGHGLGLSICRQLVESVGGTITATSSPGQGTTFLVILPSPRASHAQSKAG